MMYMMYGSFDSNYLYLTIVVATLPKTVPLKAQVALVCYWIGFLAILV